MKLREVSLLYVSKLLVESNGDRKKVREILGNSERGLRCLIQEAIEKGFLKKEILIKKFTYIYGMASNEERLRYLDEVLNSEKAPVLKLTKLKRVEL